jgi:hypothetical protein
MYKNLTTYALAGFEPRIFCSERGRVDHYATPLVGQSIYFLQSCSFDSMRRQKMARQSSKLKR